MNEQKGLEWGLALSTWELRRMANQGEEKLQTVSGGGQHRETEAGIRGSEEHWEAIPTQVP